MNKYLVISPHADDSEIGMGGTILSLTESGQEVIVLYLSSTQERKLEAIEACKILGANPLFAELEDGNFLLTEEFTSLIRKLALDCSKVFVPNEYEAHTDHRAAYEFTLKILGPSKLVQYEVWTPLTHPTQKVNITPYLSLKQQAIRCHKSQLENRFDEAVICLNRWRGIMSGTNAFAMEAFYANEL